MQGPSFRQSVPSPIPTLPFILSRSADSFRAGEYTSTVEKAHGLLRLDPDRLVIQWRVHRTTSEFAAGYSTREELDPVREVAIPLSHLAGAELKRRARWLGGSPRLVINAGDLRAFEGVAGPDGLSLENPARLELRLPKSEAEAGREFAGELALAISEWQLRLAEERARPAIPPPAADA